MLEDLFAQGQDLVSLIMSNLWWILLVGLVIVCVGEILVEGLEEFIGWAEDHVIAVLGTILTVIVGSICYIQFGLVWALVAMAAIVILAIIAYVVTGGDLMLDVGYRSRRLSKSEETMGDDEDEEYSDDEEFGDDEESESKKSVKKPVAKKGGIKMDDIAGLEEAKEAIRMRVILPVQHPEVYAKYNKKVGGGILLYGLPGTGKTMFAQAVANELDAAFYEVKCSDIVSKWYGESEQRIKKLFRDARKNKRAVIFFDEFEALGKSRNSSDYADINIVPELLAQIQGFDKNENTLLLLAATNRPWDIDSALLRPGRFNEKILIPLPDDAARRVIIEKQLHDVPVDDTVSIDEIVKLTDGFNGADVVEFCDQLKTGPIVRSIDNKTNNEKVTPADVESTAKRVKSSVSEEDIALLEEFENGNA